MLKKTCRLISLMGPLALSSFANAQWERVETVRTDVQVLTSGPVHEAFAETVVYDPEPDLVVLQPPPEPIEEVPPDVIPDGPNMTWVPGYWAWDDDRDDYLWISGIWRSVPPGRRYVPGFWTRIGHGFQWSSGFWVDADASEIEYLPEPPAPVEVAPPPAPPGPNLIWTPGVWIWEGDRYSWRPGHWVEVNPYWIWVPAHYVWGPHGYVFVDGYWDYTVDNRGILFAPVYVSPVVRTARTFVFSPSVVIDIDIFTEHLFLRPRYRHYYFGDYYAPIYVDKGIYPWFTVYDRHVAYDPIYVHRRWRHRDEPDWERRIEASFYRRRDREDERPPRTLDLQVRLSGDRAKAAVAGFVVGKTLQEMAQRKDQPFRLRAVDRSEREVFVQKAREVSKSREQRKVVESQNLDPSAEPRKRTVPVREKLPSSPIAASKEVPTTAKATAPKKPDTPQADRSIEPKPKKKVERVSPKPAQPEKPSEAPRPPASKKPEATPPVAKPAPEKKPAAPPKAAPAPKPAPPRGPAPQPVPRPAPVGKKPPDNDKGKPTKPKKDKDKDD